MRSTTALALAHQLLQVMKGVPRLNYRDYFVEGLTGSEKALLLMLAMTLNDHQKRLPVSEISGLLRITPGGVTHLLNPLAQHGYIERVPDPKDRRIVRIGLTRRGAQASRSLVSEAQRQLVGLIEHLGEQDTRLLIGLLSRSIEYFALQPADQ